MGDLLNVRCGDDIRDGLARLVGGDVLAYADPVSHGPVPAGKATSRWRPSWRDCRTGTVHS